ncbi:translation initiation factor eIF4A [Mortierella alpina]|nr:translation initiation factor eIF4A [Mortierella alpina]
MALTFANDFALNTPEDEIESNWDEVVDTFDNMGLKSELLRGVTAYGLERPSLIQQRAVRPIIIGHDVIVQASSKTGTTAMFSIAALQKVDVSNRVSQALIISRTSELAQRTTKVVLALGDSMKANCHCIDGTDLRKNMSMLKEGVHVVVGTPGRVADMISRGYLRTDYINMFVLDETDEMLACGLTDQIYEVSRRLPKDTQIVLLSATMPSDVMNFTKEFMGDPIRISVKEDELTLE